MEKRPRTNRFPPVLIVDDNEATTGALSRAIERIRLASIVVGSLDEARRLLPTRRFHYLLICSRRGDASYIVLFAELAGLDYRLPVVLLGEDDMDLRARVRSMAAEANITLHCFPPPIELGVIRVLLADQRARDAGLPVSHVWGGISSRSAYESHVAEVKKVARDRSQIRGNA